MQVQFVLAHRRCAFELPSMVPRRVRSGWVAHKMRFFDTGIAVKVYHYLTAIMPSFGQTGHWSREAMFWNRGRVLRSILPWQEPRRVIVNSRREPESSQLREGTCAGGCELGFYRILCTCLVVVFSGNFCGEHNYQNDLPQVSATCGFAGTRRNCVRRTENPSSVPRPLFQSLAHPIAHIAIHCA